MNMFITPFCYVFVTQCNLAISNQGIDNFYALIAKEHFLLFYIRETRLRTSKTLTIPNTP